MNNVWRRPAQSSCVTGELFVDSRRLNRASSAVDIILSACQPWTMTICPKTTSLLNKLHHQVRWEACVLMRVGWGWGWRTPSAWWHHSQVSMEWRSSVEPLIQLAATLISPAFPQLKRRGSVLYQAMPCTPTHPSCKHSDVSLSFIMPCNGSCTFSAGYQRSADV